MSRFSCEKSWSIELDFSFVFSACQWWKDVNGKTNDLVKIILTWRVAERNELEMESK